MNVIEIIQKFGVERLGRYYGAYRAIVLDKDDPDNTNRILVTIPTIHDGIEAWAIPKGQDGAPNSGFKWLTPNTGQIVYVEFENGDPLKPLWSYHGWAVGEIPDELGPDKLGFITPKGNLLIVSETDGIMELYIENEINITNKENARVNLKGDIVTVNQGTNRGVVNIEQIESLISSLAKDLMSVSSGQNLSTWMANELPKMEDQKFIH